MLLKVYKNPPKATWKEILQRPVFDNTSHEATVANILKEVKANGDEAIRRFSTMFDKVSVEHLMVSEKEIDAAEHALPNKLKIAIVQAKANIEKFHVAQVNNEAAVEVMPGIKCWRKSVGIEKVGLYIPGGTAPLFSTVLMLAVPAKIAGCNNLSLCTPPNKQGEIDPAILFAAKITGINKVYKVGGAQAIGAMAYGTETMSSVNKIFGPGNQYVTTAKQLVQKDGVAIDMPAGPSEVAVLADETADPSFVAADLLSQAEHGVDSQVLLVTTSAEIAQKVENEIERQVSFLPRKEVALQALQHSKIIIVPSINEAVELLNEYAAEHLIIACKQEDAIAEQVRNAGSVFVGNYSPESAGDYASGTNHTLPTNGFAKAYSGVSVDSFVKKITFQKLTKEGLKNIGATVETMAMAEGLHAHASAVSIRLK